MSFGFGGSAAAGVGGITDGLCATPGNPDSISKLSWSKVSSQFIAASNWDGQVRLYQQQQNGFGFVAAVAPHNNAPVLCVDWHHDGQSLFTSGGDCMATRCAFNRTYALHAATPTAAKHTSGATHGLAGVLVNGAIQPTPVAKHEAPIKTCSWWSDVNLLVLPMLHVFALVAYLRWPLPAAILSKPKTCLYFCRRCDCRLRSLAASTTR